jgi:predicted dehydrogenase
MPRSGAACVPLEDGFVVKIGMLSFAHMHGHSYASCVKDLPNATLVGVADEDAARGREMAQKFGAKYFDSFEALCKSAVDAVIIASDNKMHLPLTLLAAKHGKHILCEKPLARTMAEAREMLSAVKKSGVILATAFPCRFIPAMREVKDMIDAGRIGKILAIRGTNQGSMPGSWFIDRDRAGGGAVIDHTVHVTDLMRWFLNSEVKEVYAETDMRFHKIGIDDTGMISMQFENGCLATLDTSWSRPPKSYPTWGNVTMKLVLEHGTIEIDSFNQKCELFSESDGKGRWLYFGDNIDLGLVANFVAAVEGTTAVSATGYDGMKALEVALAAYESSAKKAPVALPLAV